MGKEMLFKEKSDGQTEEVTSGRTTPKLSPVADGVVVRVFFPNVQFINILSDLFKRPFYITYLDICINTCSDRFGLHLCH